MKIELLPSTIEDGKVVNKQHLSCFVIDDQIAIDAGCLSLAASPAQKAQVRDIVLTHAHIDHIAGLPLFIDDLFSELKFPVRIHASASVINVLREHIFNWKVYPDFAELENDNGPVLEYISFNAAEPFEIAGLGIKAVPVNHKVPSYGFIVNDSNTTVALTGDTAEMDGFWNEINALRDLAALFIECAFPDELAPLAVASHHLTPQRLGAELAKFKQECPIFAINLKPAYKETIVREIEALGVNNISILDIGRVYEF